MTPIGAGRIAEAPVAGSSEMRIPLVPDDRYVGPGRTRSYSAEAPGRTFTAAATGRNFIGEAA